MAPLLSSRGTERFFTYMKLPSLRSADIKVRCRRFAQRSQGRKYTNLKYAAIGPGNLTGKALKILLSGTASGDLVATETKMVVTHRRMDDVL
jgi:hypothetical protein